MDSLDHSVLDHAPVSVGNGKTNGVVEWVPASAVAARLGIPVATLRQWCEDGVVPWRRGSGANGPIALVDVAAAEAQHATHMASVMHIGNTAPNPAPTDAAVVNLDDNVPETERPEVEAITTPVEEATTDETSEPSAEIASDAPPPPIDRDDLIVRLPEAPVAVAPQTPEWVTELAEAWRRAAKAEADVEAFKRQLTDIGANLEAQETAARAAQQSVVQESRQAVTHAAHAAHAAEQAAAQVAEQAAILAAQQDALNITEDAAKAARLSAQTAATSLAEHGAHETTAQAARDEAVRATAEAVRAA